MTPTLTQLHPSRDTRAGASLAFAVGFSLLGAATTTVAPNQPPSSPTLTGATHRSISKEPWTCVLEWVATGGTQFTAAGAPGNTEVGQVSTPSATDQIETIRSLSGLTNEQIGRMFGVSRRTIHNWLSGNSMASRHEARASEILLVLHNIPGDTPTERRAALLDSSHGASVFHQLTGRLNAPIHSAGLTVMERLGL